VVGVVDTGVNYSHPDLAANIWSAPTSFTVTIGGVSITCAQWTHGFNAINNTCDPMDDNNHGTHVSGTIGAVGNNSVGVVGVNWTTSIMGLKFLSATGSGTTVDAIDAIEFAIQAKQWFANTTTPVNVRVLSNSWGGGGYSTSLLAEITKANQHGMLFPAAAGNNASNNDVTPHYPSSYSADNVIAVAATDGNDALASFSNYGATSVDLAAPGVGIWSTVRNGYASYSGTSMATPHVSGVAALVLSVCPALTAGDLKNVLLGSVDSIPGLAGRVLTGGRLNASDAVLNCGSVPPPPEPAADFSMSVSPTSRTVKRGQTTTYTVTITPLNSFLGEVTLEKSVSPSGPDLTLAGSVSFVSASPVSQQLTVSTASSTTRTTYTITIMGRGIVDNKTVSHSAVATLKVR